jgi:hypothetical protein
VYQMPHTIHLLVCDTELLLMAGSDSEPLHFLKYQYWFPVFVKEVISNLLMYLFISLLKQTKLKAKFYIKYFYLISPFIKVTI